ncbi:uncharacterized protein LOC126829116 [Patella vulgata]|uniref:uncharacterized protein LOC126829116 n=1 Tax=Patella vulgata TaxID=6465 RepID=UPI00217FA088|nr:uncharacterized protein LOC126829116 [Patella vulgata]
MKNSCFKGALLYQPQENKENRKKMMSTPGISSGILRLKRSQMKGKASGKKRSRTLYNKLNTSLNSTKIVREALNLNNRALSTEQLKIQNEIQIMKTKCHLLKEENDNLDSEIEMLVRVASLTNTEEKCQAVIEVKEKVHVTGLTNLVLETMKDVNNALKSYKFLRFILNDAEKVMDIPTDNVNTDDVNIEDHLSYTDRLETALNHMIKSADEEIIDDNVCGDTSVDEEMKASNRFNHNPCDVGLPQRIPCDSKDTPEILSDTFQNRNLVFSEMEEDYELSKTEDVSPVANAQEADVTVEDKTTKQPLSPQQQVSRLKLQKPSEDEEIVVDETIYLNTDMEMTAVIEGPINLENKNNSNSTFKKPESKASTEDFLVSLRPKQKDKFGPENLFGFEFQTPDNKVKSSFKHPDTKVISKQDKYDRLVVESEEDILRGDNSESKTLSRSKSRCRSKSKKTEDSVDMEPSLFSDEPCEIFNIPLKRESPLPKPRSKTGRSKHKKKTITVVGNDELEEEVSEPCINVDVHLTNSKVNTKDIDIIVGESKEDKNKSPVENKSKGNSRSKTRCRSDNVKKADTTAVTTAVPSPTACNSNVDIISKDNTLPVRGNTRSKKSRRSGDEKKSDTATIVPNTPVNNLDTHLPDEKLFPKPVSHGEKSRRKFCFSDGNSEDVLDEVKKLSLKSKSKKSSNLKHESHKLVSDSSSNEESPILGKRTSVRYSNEGIKEIIPTRKISTNGDDEILCIPDSCKKSKKSIDSPARNEEDVDQDDSDHQFKRSRRTKEPISYKERPINIKMRKEITDGKTVESCRLSEKGYSNAKIPLDNVTNVPR